MKHPFSLENEIASTSKELKAEEVKLVSGGNIPPEKENGGLGSITWGLNEGGDPWNDPNKPYGGL